MTPDLLWTLADERARPSGTQLLATEEERVSIEELASHVAAEHTQPLQFTNEQTAIRLHHVALPKLPDHGIVDYDRASRVVINDRDSPLPGDLADHIRTLDDG